MKAGLAFFASAAACFAGCATVIPNQATNSITASVTCAEYDTVATTSVTQRVDTFSTELRARVGTGAFLYDQTFAAALNDSQVQAAIAQATTILQAAGAVSITGPTQVSGNESLVSSSTDTVTTGSAQTSASVTTASYVGPQTIPLGDLGICQGYTPNPNPSLPPTLIGCASAGTPFSIVPGGIDFNTLTLSLVTVSKTATTTNTYLTTQLYELDGVAPSGPAPTVTSVVNGYNPQLPLSPGGLALISGSNFGTVAANVGVMVGGKAAYVYPASVTAAQIQIQIPAELSAGATTVTVTVSGSSSAPFGITLVTYAPSCQTQDSSGSGLGSVLTGSSKLVTLTAPAHPGDQLTISCTGLGPTNPPTPTGVAVSANPTTTVPSVTVSGLPTQGVSATLVTGSAGIYKVSFTVPAGDQGTQPLVVSIGGASSSNMLSVALAGLSAVVNNASFVNPGVASPGSIATVFANSLGTTTDHLSGLFPGSTSEGVQASFNGEGGPMFHLVASTGQQQIDLLVPTDLPTSGTANVQLTTSTMTYPNYTLTMVPANPGFYRIADPKVGNRFNIIAQFANTLWLTLPAATTAALGLPACTANTGVLTTCGKPAAIGDYLTIYMTGLGLATPNGDPNGKPLPTGQTAPADGSILYVTPIEPAVTVGGVPAMVLYHGLAPGFAGLYQLNIQVPPGVASSDDVPVKVTMLGASDTATISVQPRGN